LGLTRHQQGAPAVQSDERYKGSATRVWSIRGFTTASAESVHAQRVRDVTFEDWGRQGHDRGANIAYFSRRPSRPQRPRPLRARQAKGLSAKNGEAAATRSFNRGLLLLGQRTIQGLSFGGLGKASSDSASNIARGEIPAPSSAPTAPGKSSMLEKLQKSTGLLLPPQQGRHQLTRACCRAAKRCGAHVGRRAGAIGRTFPEHRRCLFVCSGAHGRHSDNIMPARNLSMKTGLFFGKALRVGPRGGLARRSSHRQAPGRRRIRDFLEIQHIPSRDRLAVGQFLTGWPERVRSWGRRSGPRAPAFFPIGCCSTKADGRP